MKVSVETGTFFRPRTIVVTGAYLGLAVAIFYLAFCNLGGRLFWEDEAETALLAKNILKYGVPRVDDGLNHISLHGDRFDSRNGVWTWSPWLPHYVAAASFAVFGVTTWAGKAPFALIGWLAVLLLSFVAWKIYRSHRVALASAFLLGTSEVFLLHIRQCRYYSITVLAEILLAYGIYQTLAKDKKGPWWIFTGLTLQFYCNYTSAVANIPALLILVWSLFKNEKATAWRLTTSLGAWVLICLPWLLYAETWRQGTAERRVGTITEMLRFYAWQFHFHFFPWCFALLPVCGCLFHQLSMVRGRANPPIDLVCIPAPAPPLAGVSESSLLRFEKYLLLLSVLYVPVLLIMPGFFSRYLLPILPLACLLVAVWLFRYIKWTAAAVAIILVQTLSNGLAVGTDPFRGQYPLRSPFADFLFSSQLPYQDQLTDVLKFFDQRARPGDVLVSRDPEFPLIFYTRLKVVDTHLASPHVLPQWILPDSVGAILREKPVELSDSLKPHYEKSVILVHDSAEDDNIPEPQSFELETAKDFSSFIIYKLKDQSSPATSQLHMLLR